MRNKKQKVEAYKDLYDAKFYMEYNIKDGWLVCTCVSYRDNGSAYDGILVVYERELEVE